MVAVPTPVDKNNNPDLTPLYGASTTVGKVIARGDIVVYESTRLPWGNGRRVYTCVEKVSGVKIQRGLFRRIFPRTYKPRR